MGSSPIGTTMNEVWFTSDTHFGHRFMADLRGFDPYNYVEGLREHDETLVQRWNERVKHGDEVWVLGDFSFQNDFRLNQTFMSLNGKKHLVVGNHDKSKVVKLPWSSVHDLTMRSFQGQKFVMCHYPMLTWQNAHRGVFHLHGHTHGNLQAPPSTRMDVGIDLHPELAPFHLDEVLDFMSKVEYDFVDHHDRGKAFKEKEVTEWPTQR